MPSILYFQQSLASPSLQFTVSLRQIALLRALIEVQRIGAPELLCNTIHAHIVLGEILRVPMEDRLTGRVHTRARIPLLIGTGDSHRHHQSGHDHYPEC